MIQGLTIRSGQRRSTVPAPPDAAATEANTGFVSAVTTQTINCQLLLEKLWRVPSEADKVAARRRSPDAR